MDPLLQVWRQSSRHKAIRMLSNESSAPAEPSGTPATPSAAIPNLRPLRVSIRSKMILLSTLLLIVVIGVFGVVNAHQQRRSIDSYSERLRRTITDGLDRTGRAQLTLLAAAARTALQQSDYGSLQAIVADAQREDQRITKVAILSTDGRLIADIGGSMSAGSLAEVRKAKKRSMRSNVLVGHERSIVFSTPITYRDRSFGIALIAYTLKPLEVELAKAEQTKRDVAAANLRNILIVGLLAALLGTLLMVIQAMRFSRPISALADQAIRIANGEFNARVDIASRDEIGRLGDTFNHMSQQILSLMQDAQTKAAMEREFEIANSIQGSLVPKSEAVSIRGLELTGFFRSASQCGGDWWSYYDVVGDKALVIIGDVTGHGVPAAMITAIVKGAASTMVSAADQSFNLPMFLEQLNALVHETGNRQFFMTCFAALYDPHTHMLTYANAGHNPPYHYEASTKKISSLLARGSWLGYSLNQNFAVQQTRVARDDVLIWYTDGIVELENDQGGMFGDSRFRRLLLKNATLPLEQMRERVITSVYDFAQGRPQGDDITLVVGRVCA